MPSQELNQKINAAAQKKKPFFCLIDFATENFEFFDHQDIESKKIEFSFPEFSNVEEQETLKINLEYTELDLDLYSHAFQKIQNELHHGNSYLTNLTFQVPLKNQNPLRDLFHAANSIYKIYKPGHFVCFSPETFVKIRGKQIATYPMKGTFTDLPNLDDPKETAEHATVVDLLRNDLSQIASNVRVTNYAYIDEIIASNKQKHYQVSSEISGTLPAHYQKDLASLILTLLPAGSVTGAPKIKTLEIIKSTEDYKRGYYTGTAWHFDGQNLTSCVMIRFIEKTQNQLFFKTGGGITADSVMEKEYEELHNKIYLPIARSYA